MGYSNKSFPTGNPSYFWRSAATWQVPEVHGSFHAQQSHALGVGCALPAILKAEELRFEKAKYLCDELLALCWNPQQLTCISNDVRAGRALQ